MSFDTYEYSQDDGAPIELFSFIARGSGLEFYYTTNDAAITFNGNSYLPLQISRDNIDQTAIIVDPQSFAIVMPRDCELADWYGKPFSPPTLIVRVWRRHEQEADYKRLFVGRSFNFKVEGDLFTVESKSLLQVLFHRVMCDNTYNNRCNHDLFDFRCTLNKDDYTWTTDVQDISGQFITVSNDHNADDVLKFGDIIIRGEYRMILANVGNIIKVRYPFTVAEVGDEVTLVQGCRKNGAACKEFNNYDNFGGYPLRPAENPIKTAIKPGVFTGTTLLNLSGNF